VVLNAAKEFLKDKIIDVTSGVVTDIDIQEGSVHWFVEIKSPYIKKPLE